MENLPPQPHGVIARPLRQQEGNCYTSYNQTFAGWRGSDAAIASSSSSGSDAAIASSSSSGLESQYHSFQKYLALRASDPNQAKQFISSFFKKNKAFEIALTHEDSGHLMSVQGMLAAIDQDLQSRADNNFEQDTVVCENMQHASREVKQAGAPAKGVVSCPVLASYTTASNRALYDLVELNTALSFVKPKKKSINHPLSQGTMR